MIYLLGEYVVNLLIGKAISYLSIISCPVISLGRIDKTEFSVSNTGILVWPISLGVILLVVAFSTCSATFISPAVDSCFISPAVDSCFISLISLKISLISTFNSLAFWAAKFLLATVSLTILKVPSAGFVILIVSTSSLGGGVPSSVVGKFFNLLIKSLLTFSSNALLLPYLKSCNVVWFLFSKAILISPLTFELSIKAWAYNIFAVSGFVIFKFVPTTVPSKSIVFAVGTTIKLSLPLKTVLKLNFPY